MQLCNKYRRNNIDGKKLLNMEQGLPRPNSKLTQRYWTILFHHAFTKSNNICLTVFCQLNYIFSFMKVDLFSSKEYPKKPSAINVCT